MEKEKLFREFPPISTEDWKNKIVTDLKGADYDRKLVWRNPEDFNIQPFYRSEDLEKLTNLDVCPGDYPFIRGKNTKGNEWLIRQDIKVNDADVANVKALDIRMKGVDSLGFIFDQDYTPKLDDIELLFEFEYQELGVKPFFDKITETYLLFSCETVYIDFEDEI